MKKSMFRKILVITLIGFFIEASVISCISINVNEKIVDKYKGLNEKNPLQSDNELQWIYQFLEKEYINHDENPEDLKYEQVKPENSNTIGLGPIRTLGWSHLNEQGTAVTLYGSLAILYSMRMFEVGFVWDTSYHLIWNDYRHKIPADDYGILNSFSSDVYQLSRTTTYHYRAIGKYLVTGITHQGIDFTFKPGLPSLYTNEASNIKEDSAVLNGELKHMGGASSCQVWFEYGLSEDNLNNPTNKQTLTSVDLFSDSIKNLKSGTTYYFHAKCSNDCGTVTGFTNNFTTSGGSGNNPPFSPSKPSGPLSGIPDNYYSYSTSTTDPDDDLVKYGWDWKGDDIVEEWDDNNGNYYVSGTMINASHAWSKSGLYNVKVKAEDIHGKQSSFSPNLTILINNPPDPPIIDGKTKGKPGKVYEYTLTSVDPDDDNVYYFIDWGDGLVEEWFGPYASGETARAEHSWDEKGAYIIKAKSRDLYDSESDWVTLSVSMPKNKPYTDRPFLNFLQNFFEKFPNAFPILRQIIQRLGLQ